MKSKHLPAAALALALLLLCAAPALAAQPGSVELSIVNYVDFGQVDEARLEVFEDRTDLIFTLRGGGFDGACLGRSFAPPADGIAAPGPDGSFTLTLPQTAEPFAVSLRSAADGAWLERQFRLYADTGDLDVWESWGAVPTSQRLTVDGIERTTEIYNIGGYNYFKLRAVAALLTGTDAQFNVDYDADRLLVVLSSGAAYVPQPGDLAVGADKSESAMPTLQGVMLDGELLYFDNVYNIGGNNFVKLRDLGAALGFGVDYDPATATMLVTTK